MDAAGHREYILAKFCAEFRKKYDAGQEEHGGKLWESRDTFEEAIREVIDLVAYLYTYREFQRMPVYGAEQRQTVAEAVVMPPHMLAVAERIKWVKQYKTPLLAIPIDRKLSILAEEFGEVARAVMEKPDEDPGALRNELLDLAGFALTWVEFIDNGNINRKAASLLAKDRD